MQHDYKLLEFSMNEVKVDTDITVQRVVIYLREKTDIPEVLTKRIEHIVNQVLSDYEDKICMTLPIESLNLEVTLEADRKERSLFIGMYLGSTAINDGTGHVEVIPSDDADYQPIKAYFFKKLNEYVADQVKEIMRCIE